MTLAQGQGFVYRNSGAAHEEGQALARRALGAAWLRGNGDVGLALQGGGGKGCGQWGMIEAVQEHVAAQGRRISHVSGVSIGALNGMLLGQALGQGRSERPWAIDFVDGPQVEGYLRLRERLLRHRVPPWQVYGLAHSILRARQWWLRGLRLWQLAGLGWPLPSPEPLFRQVRALHDAEALARPGAPVVYATYLEGGRQRLIVENSRDHAETFVRAVCRAMRFPAYGPERGPNGEWYWDAGEAMNLNVEPLLDAGCRTIVALLNNPDRRREELRPRRAPWAVGPVGAVARMRGEALGQAVAWTTYHALRLVERVNRQAELCGQAAPVELVVIRPEKVYENKTHEFDGGEAAAQDLAHGYDVARRTLAAHAPAQPAASPPAISTL